MNSNEIELLGVRINTFSPQEVIETVDRFFSTKNKHYIVTPNPEFLVLAHRDRQFKDILNYADIAIPDGIGLLMAAKLMGKRLRRFTGVDLVWYLCEFAQAKQLPIFLLGGFQDAAEQAAITLRRHFPDLIVVGSNDGGVVDDAGLPDHSEQLIYEINAAKPKIIFVAFGHGKQERWIFKNLDRLTSVQLAVGVGGTFDFLAGRANRAPEIIQRLGLEWLYRLITQPWRWRRILNAVIIFPLLVILDTLKKKIFTR